MKELALKYEGTDIGKRYAEILQKVADGTWDVTDHMKGMGEEANRLNTIISNLKDLFSSLLDLVNSANDKKSNDLKIQGDAWIGSAIKGGGLIKGSISEFFGFGNSSTGNPLDNLISSSKSNTLAQLDSMKSQFEKTWKDMAKEVGLSDDQIDATSKEMYGNMQKLVKDTYAAIGDNTALNAEQVEGITKKLFQSMQNTYTAGFNKMASMTDEMSESNANKMANSFNSMKDSCSNAMDSISSKMKNSWNQCGGGIRNLSAKTQSTISKAWADTTGDTEKMLYDMRACFDSSWGIYGF